MKKSIRSILIISITIFMFMNVVFAAKTSAPEVIKANNVSLQGIPSIIEGKVTISGNTQNQKIKILVVKDEKQRWYDVNLEEGSFDEEIWLIDGKGNYKVSVLVHLEERRYSFGPTVYVENTIEVNRFLVPTLHVESDDDRIINLANEITKDALTDMEKAKRIHNWVASNIRYDYGKYLKQLNKNFDNDYGALNTLKTGMGVCYDYSTLVAALGRAVDLQVKVIKGNYVSPTRNELHAWNEIYIAEESRWINLDTTFAASMRKNYFDNSDFYNDHEKLEEY